MKPRIIVSGVNLVEAGPLAVFQDALKVLAGEFAGRYEVIALVHKTELFDIPGITFMQYPAVKQSWLRRVWFEYVQCYSISKQLNASLWLAMHDMTPRVVARVQAVYCHNPSPFRKLMLREIVQDLRPALFTQFYGFLYSFRIRKNNFVIVQQQWLRVEFRRRYRKVRQIIVAHPSPIDSRRQFVLGPLLPAGSYRFFYPAFPRAPKNFEVLLDACRLLQARGITGFELSLTIDGTENAYSRAIRLRYRDLDCVQWKGAIAREQVEQEYGRTDCLVFPSLVETWGMPITEFKVTRRPLLVADLPYAHETVGEYDAVHFFPAKDALSLADAMQALLAGQLVLKGSRAVTLEQPFAEGWLELFNILLNKLERQP